MGVGIGISGHVIKTWGAITCANVSGTLCIDALRAAHSTATFDAADPSTPTTTPRFFTAAVAISLSLFSTHVFSQKR
jgi:hypothetical protein